MYLKSNAIILNKLNVSEFDKLVTLYTLELGKIKVLFRSANKLQAKMHSFLENANEIELQIYVLKRNSLDYNAKAAGCKLINSFLGLRKNLNNYLYALRVVEIADALTLDISADEKKYYLIKRALELLENTDNIEPIFFAYILRFIKLCGYMPELNSCVKCKKKINNLDVFFSLNDGGVICYGCKNIVKNSFANIKKLSFSALDILQKLSRLSGEQVLSFRVDKKYYLEIEDVLYSHLRFYLHRPIKSITLSSAKVC